jgi:lysophospholipase L1-like esterase
MKNYKIASLIISALFLFSFQSEKKEKPTIWIIGDSTVKNGQGDGAGGLWGWGDFIVQYFDTTKIAIRNHALGGTSSRTFRTLGKWDPVFSKLKPGDYLLMQFGHNDAGKLNDDSRARGTIKGVGDESEEIDNILTKKHETVHSFGWYMRQYIQQAKAKGVIPVIMSPIPRNDWKDGRVPRNNSNSYGLWAKQVAASENIQFIDLNEKMASVMEKLGEQNVTGTYFYKRDHTHTSAKGAVLSASLVVEGLKESSQNQLKNYLLENPKIKLPVKKNVFIIGDSTVANGDGKIVGWGKMIPEYFDTMRINIYNKARGGRSSRTFCYEGLWKEVEEQLQPGDFVIMQFGHNDGSNIDKEKFRGSLKGTGDETQEITRTDGTKETVHSYGWYMKKYIAEAKALGAEVIVLSQIPRNEWPKGKVERVADSYGGWAKEAAEKKGGIFLDLNETMAQKYEELGTEKVKTFFPGDHTHTNLAGAELNAITVAELIKGCRESKLRDYIFLSEK